MRRLYLLLVSHFKLPYSVVYSNIYWNSTQECGEIGKQFSSLKSIIYTVEILHLLKIQQCCLIFASLINSEQNPQTEKAAEEAVVLLSRGLPSPRVLTIPLGGLIG